VFVGEYQHTMDGKGRVVLPARFRKALEKDGCVLTKGQDECVFIWPTDDWEEEAERMKRLPSTNSRSRAFKRSFFTGSEPQSVDAQGRITIPHSFRSFASLEKDLAIVGVAERIEIWDAARWNQVSIEADQIFAHIEEDFPE
jgi:MraZ protein